MTQNQGNGAAMTVVGSGSAAIEPQTMGELASLALSAAQSGFYGAKNKEQALMLMIAGKDLGLSYAQALRAFHIIEGRPSLSADGMVAVCLNHPDKCEYFITVESTDTIAIVETKRRGHPKPQRMSFSLEDAKRAGLFGRGNWAKYPAAMLRARAKSSLARDVYADLLLGIYDPDETEDRARARNTGPVEGVIEGGNVVQLARQSSDSPVPPIAETALTPEGRAELEAVLLAGLLACRSPEAMRSYWATEVLPKSPDLDKHALTRLTDAGKRHVTALAAAPAAPPAPSSGAVDDEDYPEPGSNG